MTIAAAALTVELLRFPFESRRAIEALSALAQHAAPCGIDLVQATTYLGGSDLLLLWGPGATNRFDPMRRQIAASGHVVALDVAYWQREAKFRVSFDAAHPQHWVMRHARPGSRLERDGIAMREDAWDPSGPVVLAGIGDKAGVQYGVETVRDWEHAVIAQVRAAGRAILYRPKRPNAWVPDGIAVVAAGPIEPVLVGASALITWHSNVAVDAIRAGIPAVCLDGAAAAVCPNDWRPDLRPLVPSLRRQFLANLAWFQWAPSEAPGCWSFIRETLA